MPQQILDLQANFGNVLFTGRLPNTKREITQGQYDSNESLPQKPPISIERDKSMDQIQGNSSQTKIQIYQSDFLYLFQIKVEYMGLRLKIQTLS